MLEAEDHSGTIERLLVIKAMPLFADVPPEDLAILAEHARLQAFRKGEVLFSGKAQPATTIHLVLQGRIVEHRSGVLFRVHGAGRILGGVDALALSTSDVMAVADEETTTLSIDRAALADILEDNFGILWVTLQGVAEATLQSRRRLRSAGFERDPDPGDITAEPPRELATQLEFLRHHTRLERVKIRTLAQLVLEAEMVTHGADARLWSIGDTAEHVIIVIHGIVACSTPDGSSRFEVGRGAILGLEEALAMQSRWYDAATRGSTALLSITRSVIVDALEDDSDSAVEALAVMATVASELRDLVARRKAGEEP